MSTSTTKNADKIKLLDQMLEDIAGDELEEYNANEPAVNTILKRYTEREDLDIIDIMH